MAREDRYIVVKKSHLTPEQLSKLKSYMHLANVGTVPAVVVEADWPEYEPVWKMIEDRVAGRHRQSSSNAGGVVWQPIDTAPMTGETILAICASAYTPTAFDTWWQDGWTHYSRPDGKWHGGVGKWFPTHWMPRETYLASLSTPTAEPPSPCPGDGMRGAFPESIGRLTLGDKLSSDHYCGGSHEMPNGHPVYWQQRGGEYPDDIEGFCLACAIDQAEGDAGWCDCSIRDALSGDNNPTPDRIGKDAVREAVADLLAHRVGDVPGQGWLRDNDQSRAALAKLAALTDTKGDRPMGDR